MKTSAVEPSKNGFISLRDWYASANFNDLAGYRIAWWQQGEGEPLVLIHGFPTAAWDWQYVWATLSRQFRVITLDLLGFGKSAKPWPHRYSIFEQADIVLALVQALDLQHFHVLAHDYGDTVAQELLARHNECNEESGFLKSVGLLNGGLFPETHHPVMIQKLLMSPIGPLLSRLVSRRSIASNFNHIFGAKTPPTEEELDGFWSLIKHDNGARVFPGLIRYMQERREHRERWVGALQRATIPLKLINGNADPISGLHMAKRYEALVASADITHLPTIGHYPQVEAPAEVLSAYLDFYERRVKV